MISLNPCNVLKVLKTTPLDVQMNSESYEETVSAKPGNREEFLIPNGSMTVLIVSGSCGGSNGFVVYLGIRRPVGTRFPIWWNQKKEDNVDFENGLGDFQFYGFSFFCQA